LIHIGKTSFVGPDNNGTDQMDSLAAAEPVAHVNQWLARDARSTMQELAWPSHTVLLGVSATDFAATIANDCGITDPIREFATGNIVEDLAAGQRRLSGNSVGRLGVA
jgi:hypothetical protein